MLLSERPRPSRAATAALAVLVTVVALLAASTGASSATGSATGPAAQAAEPAYQPKAAAKPAVPGSLTGYAFDTCTAPAQAVMDAWWLASPYSAVGVYIGGSNRLCEQPELDAGWVKSQVKRGWRVLPLYVGPQASCSGYADKMSPDLTVAGQQGRAQADAAVDIARGLGITMGATLYYDLEDYDIGPDDCRRAALSFLSGWTEGLHAAGYDSGVYSNIAAAITSLDYADLASPGSYTMPDDIWFAWANGRADTVTDERVQSTRWDDHARIHQYALDVQQSHGGYALTIDANWADVGKGSVAATPKPLCRAVDVDLRRYPTLRLGKRGPAVSAAQCLLRRTRFMTAPITGRYDARTVAAVRKAQRRLDLKDTGRLTRPTWTALLARGRQPVAKVGSTGDTVLRLQRSLTAALGRPTKIDGVFSKKTAKAVAKYQRKQGLAPTGVVTTEVWNALEGD
jgi:peptidoglycan hydrolase-like protein with peptidoglycan-binding domain